MAPTESNYTESMSCLSVGGLPLLNYGPGEHPGRGRACVRARTVLDTRARPLLKMAFVFERPGVPLPVAAQAVNAVASSPSPRLPRAGDQTADNTNADIANSPIS